MRLQFDGNQVFQLRVRMSPSQTLLRGQPRKMVDFATGDLVFTFGLSATAWTWTRHSY